MTFCSLKSKKVTLKIMSDIISNSFVIMEMEGHCGIHYTEQCAVVVCFTLRQMQQVFHTGIQSTQKLCTSYLLAVSNSQRGDQEIKPGWNDQRTIGAAEKLTEIEQWPDLHTPRPLMKS